jgi:hypothetical protein
MKTLDFSTLYTTIPHTLLKSRIKELIKRCFSKRNREQGISILLLVETRLTLSKAIQNRIINTLYKQDNIIQMLDFLFIGNIFVLFGDCFSKRLVFQ